MGIGEGSGEARSRFRGTLDVTLDLPLASVGSRGLAALVDVLLLVLIVLVIFAGGTLAGGFLILSPGVIIALTLFALFAVFWGYFAISEIVLDGQTPGKRLVGLRAVMEDGTPLLPLAAIIRNLVRFADFLPASYGFGVAAMMLTRNSQRLGDIAAGTLVVREREPASVAAWGLRWPEGFGAEDVALVETYLGGLPELQPDRREQLATLLLAWLERDHPEFAALPPPWRGAPPSERVRALFALPPEAP